MSAEVGPCPEWCYNTGCSGEHYPGTDSHQDLPVVEALTGTVLLSVFPVWDEIDDLLPQVSLYLNNDTQIYMTAGQARKVAAWLLEAADKVDIRKMFAAGAQ